MMTQDGALTSPQIEAARLVFEGCSQREAARRIDVPEATLRRWTQKPNWQVYLDELRTAASQTGIKAAVATLAKASSKAARVMVELMDDDKPEVRRAAAADVLGRCGIGEHLFNHDDKNEPLVSKDELVKALREAGITADDMGEKPTDDA